MNRVVIRDTHPDNYESEENKRAVESWADYLPWEVLTYKGDELDNVRLFRDESAAHRFAKAVMLGEAQDL